MPVIIVICPVRGDLLRNASDRNLGIVWAEAKKCSIDFDRSDFFCLDGTILDILRLLFMYGKGRSCFKFRNGWWKGTLPLKNQGICVILNVAAGKRDAKSEPENIRAAFSALGAKITLKVLDQGSQLLPETKKALADGYQTIVAAGGDGTICTVAETLSGSTTVMGILPFGTFNYFARSLDLPMELEAATKVIVDGHTVPLRVATVNDRIFLNNASLGAYPAILEQREQIYRRWGRTQIAAYWAVIKTLVTVRSSLRLTLKIDGKTRVVRTPLVFVVNNAYQLQQLSLEGTDKIKAGQLAVFIAPDATRIGLIRHASAVALGVAAAERNFELVGGKDVVIERTGRGSRRSSTVAKDGERERMQGPFRFQVVKNALRVLVPAGRTAEVR